MKNIPVHTPRKSAVACNNCSLSELCLPRGLTRDELELLEKTIDKTTKIKKATTTTRIKTRSHRRTLKEVGRTGEEEAN